MLQYVQKWQSSCKVAYFENFWTCFKMALLRGWHFSGWHKARPYCIHIVPPPNNFRMSKKVNFGTLFTLLHFALSLKVVYLTLSTLFHPLIISKWAKQSFWNIVHIVTLCTSIENCFFEMSHCLPSNNLKKGRKVNFETLLHLVLFIKGG